ncbi:immunity 71 family protein [Rugamonas sp. A1-17]|nr:immunity 71 family protein [Rugamonas sp. A1-17]
MKKSAAADAVMLPCDFERQQIFYWLQKVSSVTAWHRIFEFYKAWATATENSVREAHARGWNDKTALPQAEYALILKGLAHCEEGILRLGKGDKRVFKFDANGEFAMARRILFHWAEMTTRIEMGENIIDEKHTPLWGDFCNTLTAACQAWQECARHILEPRYLDEPGRTLYGDWLRAELKVMPFPKELDVVPNPTENTFVSTDNYTPCSGIWEPIEVPKASFLSLLVTTPKPQPPFKIMGAMNYLHGGAKAPKITVETATDNFDLNTTWRLLWRDDRYNEGAVPKEEALYHFTAPKEARTSSPGVWKADEITWAESGAVASVAGRWLVESDLHASVTLQQGQKLPLYQGREVRWVLAND